MKAVAAVRISARNRNATKVNINKITRTINIDALFEGCNELKTPPLKRFPNDPNKLVADPPKKTSGVNSPVGLGGLTPLNKSSVINALAPRSIAAASAPEIAKNIISGAEKITIAIFSKKTKINVIELRRYPSGNLVVLDSSIRPFVGCNKESKTHSAIPKAAKRPTK
jgi:hypothetical protein